MLIKNELFTGETSSVDERFQASSSSSPTPQASATNRADSCNSADDHSAQANHQKKPATTDQSAHQPIKGVGEQSNRRPTKIGNGQARHDDNGSATIANETSGSAPEFRRNEHARSNSNSSAPSSNSRRELVIDSKQDAPQSLTHHSIESQEPADVITIIHFNDCYNIEPGAQSSGAAGFLTAINQYRHLKPMILFSGDILSPSFMSTFTKGEQMIPVLNDIGVDCAVFGNHEFDYGLDNLIEFTKRTTFPWLLSNVIDKETSNQLGDGLVYHIIERGSIRFGLIGLIEEEWLSTLSTLDSSDVIYTDFVTRGRELARWLKGPEQSVDYVIALTHFRTPNDVRLADSVPEIDLILGGHDHDYETIQRPNCHIIKSGTDFREFSIIKLKLNAQYLSEKDKQVKNMIEKQGDCSSEAATNGRRQTTAGLPKPFLKMDIERVDCASYPPEPNLKSKLDKFVTTIDEKMGKVLGQFNCELDGRFSSIRNFETNLGNFVTDIMLASTHADLAILNSGTLRSDRIHPKGDFTMRDLFNILGYIDPIAVLQASGYHIWKALENGVSQWPKLEGRFPQISGCSFVFDPSKPALERIDPADIMVGDEPLVLDKQYKLTTKAYLASGKDGYDVLKECVTLVPGDESPDLTTSILNHFEAINIIKSNRRTHHRQSIICLSRSSIQKILDQTMANNENHQSSINDDNNNNNNNNNNTDCAINEDEEEEPKRQDTRHNNQRLIHDKQPEVDHAADNVGNDGCDNEIGDAINNGSKCNEHCCSGVVKDPLTSSPLLGSAAPTTPTLGNTRSIGTSSDRPHQFGYLAASSPATIHKQPRQPRTKRVMSLYEMEHEQCKLEPKVEGRIKILGVNY